MGPSSDPAALTSKRVSSRTTRDALLVKIADADDEFEQIHRLNYETFVAEVGQYPPNADGRLVDPHHGRNVYFIAKKAGAVVGMICLTPFDGVAFSIEKRLHDPRVIDPYRAHAVEIRLLAVRKDVRSTAVFARIACALAEYAIARGFRYGLISGVTSRTTLYRRLGFVTLGDAVPAGAAAFVPMVVSLERFLAFARQNRSFVGDDAARPLRGGDQPVLLTPGPVSVHPAVLAALAQGAAGLHHRTAAFTALLSSIESLLRRVFGVPEEYGIAMVGASGTGVVEAMVRLATALPRPRALILVNGHFCSWLQQIAHGIGLDHAVQASPPDRPLDLHAIRAALAADPRIGSVVAVHMETSVGQLNELSEVAAICAASGAHLLVDMVSSLGGERFDFRSIAPSVAVSVSGKALAAFPGVGLVFVRRDLLESISRMRGSHYLDLVRHVTAWSEQRTIPFTLPVTLFPPLHQALVQIEAEGLAAKIARHESNLRHLETWLLDSGFGRVAVHHPSSTTRTFEYEAGGEARFDRLSERARSGGYLWYQNPHYHRPARQFQVSTMGWIPRDGIDALVERLGRRHR